MLLNKSIVHSIAHAFVWSCIFFALMHWCLKIFVTWGIFKLLFSILAGSASVAHMASHYVEVNNCSSASCASFFELT